MYLKNLRQNSPYLIDENGISVISPFGDKSSLYLIKDAAIGAFRAFTACDAKNQKEFIRLLAEQMVKFAVDEYDWNPDNANERIKRVVLNPIAEAYAQGWADSRENP